MFRNAARISRPVVRNAAVSSRAFSSTRIAASQVTSLHTFTEEEEMLRESGMFVTSSALSKDSTHIYSS